MNIDTSNMWAVISVWKKGGDPGTVLLYSNYEAAYEARNQLEAKTAYLDAATYHLVKVSKGTE